MHPAIAIVTTLIVLGFLAAGGAATIIAVAGLLLVGYLQVQPAFSGARRMLRQLRWLLLSLVVLYGWFTPGDPLVEAVGAISPTREGVLTGLERLVLLVLMVLVVNLLLVVVAVRDLCAGLYWLLAPLQRIGFPAERFAVRLSLTLDAVTHVRERVVAARESVTESGRLARFGAVATTLYRSVLSDAGARPVSELEVVMPAAPPTWQWFLPLAIAALLTLFGEPGLGG